MEFDYNTMFVSPKKEVENFYDEDVSVKVSTSMKTVYYIILIAVLLWVAIGIAAFVMSIICFSRSGGVGYHVAGLLLAIFFGPFYWIYYFVVKSYCKKIPVAAAATGGSRRRS